MPRTLPTAWRPRLSRPTGLSQRRAGEDSSRPHAGRRVGGRRARGPGPGRLDCVRGPDRRGPRDTIRLHAQPGGFCRAARHSRQRARRRGRVHQGEKGIASWWAANKSKPPTLWLLDRLAARGYNTRNPANGEATSVAIHSALRSKDDLERYAAARFMARAFPDGDSLVVRRFLMFRTDDNHGTNALETKPSRADALRLPRYRCADACAALVLDGLSSPGVGRQGRPVQMESPIGVGHYLP